MGATDDAQLRLIITAQANQAEQALKAFRQNLKDSSEQTRTTAQATSKMSEQIGSALSTLANGAKAALGAFSVRELVRGFQDVMGSTLQLGLQVRQLSFDLGMSEQEASRLRAAIVGTGVETQSVVTGLGIMAMHLRNLGDAGNPFRQLRVAVVDTQGQLRPMMDILKDVADRINALPAGISRVMVIREMFGRGGEPLLRFFEQGRQGIEQLMASADKFGTVFQGGQLNAIMAYQRATIQLEQTWLGLKTAVGMQLIPTVVAFMQGLEQLMTDVLPRVRDAMLPVLSVFRSLWGIVTNVADILKVLWTRFWDNTQAGRMMQNMVKGIGDVLSQLSNRLKLVADWLTHMKERIVNTDVGGALRGLWEQIKAAVSNGVDTVTAWLADPENAKKTLDSFISFVQKAFDIAGHVEGVISGAVKALTGSLSDTLWGGKGGGLFDKAALFIDNFFKAGNSVEGLEKLFEAGKTGGKVLLDALGNAADVAVNVAFAALGLMRGFAKIFIALVKNLPEMIDMAVAFLAGLVTGIIQETPKVAVDLWNNFWRQVVNTWQGLKADLHLAPLSDAIMLWVKNHSWGDIALEILARIATFGLVGAQDVKNGWDYLRDHAKAAVGAIDWSAVALEILVRIATFGLLGTQQIKNAWEFLRDHAKAAVGNIDWGGVALEILARIATFGLVGNKGIKDAWAYVRDHAKAAVGSLDWSAVALEILVRIATFGLVGAGDIRNAWAYVRDHAKAAVGSLDWSGVALEILTRVATFGLLGSQDIKDAWQYIKAHALASMSTLDWSSVALTALELIAGFDLGNAPSAPGAWHSIFDSVRQAVTSMSWTSIGVFIVNAIAGMVNSLLPSAIQIPTIKPPAPPPVTAPPPAAPPSGPTYGPPVPGSTGGPPLPPVEGPPPPDQLPPWEGPPSPDQLPPPPPTHYWGGGGGGGKVHMMAEGAVFMPRPGGQRVNARVAERGVPEAYLPLDPAVFQRLGLSGGPPQVVVQVFLDGREISSSVKTRIMQDIRNQRQLAY